MAYSLGPAGGKTYINGSPDGTNANTANVQGWTISNIYAFCGDGSRGASFNGDLDELRIFNEQLSDAEVLAIANASFHM